MMSNTEIWLTIIGLTLLTVVMRNVFLVLGHRVTLPPRVQHALRYAPACALVAVILPELVLQPGIGGGGPVMDLASPKLIAGAVAIASLLLTRHSTAAIVLGMAAYLLLR